MPTYDENGALLVSFTGGGILVDHQHSAAGDGGPLAVGVTDTDLTAGSVMFAGVGGLLQEDNANLFWDNVSKRLGVGINVMDGTIHAHTATAGAVSAPGTANDLVVENSTDGGMTILVPDASEANLFFGTPSDSAGAILRWEHDADLFTIGSANASAEVRLVSANIAEAIRIDSVQQVGFNKTSVDRRVHAMDDSVSTGAIIPIARLESQVSGGAGAAGHGPSLELYGESSTTLNQSMGELAARWSVATHASRRARIELRIAYIGTDALCGVIEAPAFASADGNARGTGAVDLQGYRTAATQVANGTYAVIGGGSGNTASANAATVPGGFDNVASGVGSFAHGSSGTASHTGSWVWASAAATVSWGNNTWTARCHGGARFYSAAGVGTGVQLSSGGNAWAAISTRAAKMDFRDVGDIIQKVATLPMYNYALKSQSPDVRHIGPVAEDFNAIFGFTEAESYINSMDISGVALAAIKALIERVEQLERMVQ